MRRAIIFILLTLYLGHMNIGSSQDEVCKIQIKFLNFKGTQISINKAPVRSEKKGEFCHTFNLSEPSFVTINYGEEFDLYMRPGGNVNLTIASSQNKKDIAFNGDLKKINDFMIWSADHSKILSQDFEKNFKKIVSLNEEQYKEKVDQLFNPYYERLKEIPNTELTQKTFKQFLHGDLLFSKASLLIRYPNWHRGINKKPDYIPSADFFRFMKSLNLNDHKFMDLHGYKVVVDNFIALESEKLLKNSSSLQYKNYYPIRSRIQIILDHFTNTKIKNKLLYDQMYKLMTEYYHKGIDDLLVLFNENCDNKKYKKDIHTLYMKDKNIPERVIVKKYKKIGDIGLDVFIYLPPGFKKSDQRTALAFFHGGGWECGKPHWGDTQCKHFASKGIVSMSFEYRLITPHGTTPKESMMDAKSAIRWMRQNSSEYGIDISKIIASGFSAGGHIAACTATTSEFNEPGEDLSISSKANTILLWGAPVRVEEDGWFIKVLKDKSRINDCSPYQSAKPDLPPMIMFQGTKDNQVPFHRAKEFSKKMQNLGNRFDLHLYEGQTHLGWGENGKDVLNKMDEFLISIGFLKE